MEQVTPEQNPQAPETQNEQQPAKSSFQLPAFQLPSLRLPTFLTQIGQDVRWYYDVRLYVPVILVLVILAACAGSKLGAAQEPEAVPVETQLFEVAPPVAAVETQAPTEAPIDPEAEALAILAESVGFGRSKAVKTAIMWVAINRSEDRANGMGLSLLEEIARPEQWQNYDPEMAYSQITYQMAQDVLKIRDTGGLRPLDDDMLWMVLNNDGSITVRDMFVALAGQKWTEKTIK